MSKEYVCNSCKGIIASLHDVKMKESYVGCSFEVDGVYPSFDKRKAKIRLCDKCFLGLRKISEKTVQEWISVKDRLPENDQRVLCFNYNGEYKVLRWNYIDWMWNSGIEWLKEDYVLYWMPLPQPPKGE